MKYLFAVVLVGMTLGVVPFMPLPLSQSFSDRVQRLTARITNAQEQGALAPGQQTLLTAQLDAAKRANEAHDSNVASMLDVIDRQMAQIDHGLSRAENGTAIVVHVGQSVTVAMQDQYVYDLHLSDPSIIVARPGIMYTRGIQGIYTAQAPGTVTITLEPRAGESPAPPPDMQKPVRFVVVVLAGQR
jgi:hypothetical protein